LNPNAAAALAAEEISETTIITTISFRKFLTAPSVLQETQQQRNDWRRFLRS
jgi:hypothetical protein